MPTLVRVFARFVSLIAFLAAVTGVAYAAPPAQQANWTVMVYISGDNDLEAYVIPDIETELAAVGSSDRVQIVALADRGPRDETSSADWKSTLLFHVTAGMSATRHAAVADWGERNMADPQTLIEFVTWTRANYPADHYALYFWGHGSNWRPGFVMQDDTDEDTLDMDELKVALPSLGFIDMVGYDGCNMASIEVQLLWYGHATALAHSQEWVGGEGVEYDVVLAQLAENPNMSAEEVAIATSQSATGDKTWSAVALDRRFDDLLTAIDQWAEALSGGLAANRKKYDRAFSATRSFWQAPTEKDLYDMAYEVNRLISDPNIKRKSQAVMSAIDAVILHERHINAYRDVHGITIFQISKAKQMDADYGYYQDLDFALQTDWDEFLEAYAR